MRGTFIPSHRAGPMPGSESTTRINDLAMPHIESFNYMLDEGIAQGVADIPQREIKLLNGETMTMWLEEASIGMPMKTGDSGVVDPRLFPAECRERGMTYQAPLNVTICRRVNGGEVQKLQTKLGEVPIMVRSSHCQLAGMGPLDLVKAHEEASEFGGYFICNGIERIIRMLQIPKRNHPMAITRGAYQNRGPLYSNKGVVMRCVRPDQSSVTLTLHYLNDGSATVRFTVRKQEFFLPVIMVLKALVGTTDREIYERVLAGDRSNTYLSDRVLMLLRDAKRYESALHSREAALAYLGARFKTVLDVPESFSDVQVGQNLLDRFVLVHLKPGAAGGRDKYNLLILMLRKLYAFVAGAILEDNADSLANQELLLSGHLLQLFIKEKLYEFTQGIETSIKKDDLVYTRMVAAQQRAKTAAADATAEAAAAGAGKAGKSKKGKDAKAVPEPAPAMPKIKADAVDLNDAQYFRKIVERQPEVGKKVYYLLATGNMVSSSGLDLMQVSGYTVVADKINFLRFTTHFRSVHRGQFFTEMKTTTVRKLLPENWGFLCPVHTPDGGPCGLLNHLAAPATVVAHPLSEDDFKRTASKVSSSSSSANAAEGDISDAIGAPGSFQASMAALLVSLGMVPHSATGSVLPADHLPVMLDGRVLGGAPPHTIYRISRALRRAKALVANTRAQIDGVDGPAPFSQSDAVAKLRRAAVLGLTDHAQVSNRSARSSAASKGNSSSSGDSSSASSGAGSGLEGLGVLGVVPPSMEVAFIPPSWWDAEVDPLIQDPVAAETRASKLSFVGSQQSPALTAGSSASSSAEIEEKKGEDKDAAASSIVGTGTGLAADDDREPPTKLVGLFPGLFLHTAPQRLIRPVIQLDTGLVELISPQEQPYLDIACTPEDVEEILHRALDERDAAAAGSSTSSSAVEPAKAGKKDKSKRKASDASSIIDMTSSSSHQQVAQQQHQRQPLLYTHIELSAGAMLSELACLTPFSDMNQSPRNMYQCQMAKQTMGTPLHSWSHRPDTKLFRLQTTQAPLVQNAHQGFFGFDEYPNGCNACVAVIAYTGYDMEDACIINKSSFERGFGWASVYKTYEVDLCRDRPSADAGRFLFHNQYVKGEQPVRGANVNVAGTGTLAGMKNEQVKVRPGDKVFDILDEDGLPPVGLLVKEGDPLYAFLDSTTFTHKVARHKEIEQAYVDEVRILAPTHTTAAAAHTGVQRVSIKLRFDRRPVVGDKFSSRHGQKGVLSYLWPQENMPFSDQGMTPDVIINPHAFPSRMTIGMLVESMAGKAGALHGVFQDATPFRFNEQQRAVDHFGEQLAAAGYNYYGTETFYSGMTGEPLACDIYYGVVYYQRLRHMVSNVVVSVAA